MLTAPLFGTKSKLLIFAAFVLKVTAIIAQLSWHFLKSTYFRQKIRVFPFKLVEEWPKICSIVVVFLGYFAKESQNALMSPAASCFI